jgi:Spy/CpxP family protein refolding chaperone
MTSKHNTNGLRWLPLWAGVLSLVLGFPLLALASGYGHGDTNHAIGKASPHQTSSTMGHAKSPHGGMKGSRHGGHGMKGGTFGGGHGPHQSASKFIDHILKFKDGMAITEDQVARLQAIKSDFQKTKITMKADIQLTSVDLHDLLRDDKGSLSEVEAKLKDLYNTKAGMYLASVKATRDAKTVLTDEQRARMKTVHDRINAYKSSGMESKGHPGGYKHHEKEQKS